MESFDLEVLKRDLQLRGYSDDEIQELLNLQVLFIPGELTPSESVKPTQKLTDQLVVVFKELQKYGIKTNVAVDKTSEKIYVEERHAFIDLGTIYIALQVLGNLADLATILDYIQTIIQVRFSKQRNEQLMPSVKYTLIVSNGKKSMSRIIEGRVDKLKEIVSSDKLVEEIAKEVLK